MALTYGFYNSLKGDRKYDAMQFSEIIDTLIIDGIIPSKGQLFAVTTAENGMQINVGTGLAWFFHSWTKNDSVMVLTVEESDITRPRIDAVVLEVDRTEAVRANAIKIVKGVPAVNAEKPTLVTTDKVHQYPLAYITVPAAAEEIKAENIENMVGRSPTVFATGVLETAPLDDLWNQWEGEWDTWFAAIKLQLSGDVVTNLQLQIDELKENLTFDDGTDIKDAVTNLENKTLAKIGDVKITIRNDLGKAWALANGAEITDAEALKHVNILDKQGTAWVTNSPLKTAESAVYGSDNAKGIFAQYVSESSNGVFRVKFTTNFKTWSTVNVNSGLSDTTHTVSLLQFSIYLNKWVLLARANNTAYFVLFVLDNSSDPVVRTVAQIGYKDYFVYMTSNGCFYYYGYSSTNYDYISDASYQKYSFDLINWSIQPIDESGLAASSYSRSITTMEYVGGYYWRVVSFRGTVGSDKNVQMMYVYRSSSISTMGSQVLALNISRTGYIPHTIANGVMYIKLGNEPYIIRNNTINIFSVSHSTNENYFGFAAYEYNQSTNRIIVLNIGSSNDYTVSIYTHTLSNGSQSLVATINTSNTLFPYPYAGVSCVFNCLRWISNSTYYYKVISYYLPKITLDNAYCYIKVRDE